MVDLVRELAMVDAKRGNQLSALALSTETEHDRCPRPKRRQTGAGREYAQQSRLQARRGGPRC
jgi:hypothetical protein